MEERLPYQPRRLDTSGLWDNGLEMFWATDNRLLEIDPEFTGCAFVFSVRRDDGTIRHLRESWFCTAEVVFRNMDSSFAWGRTAERVIYGTRGTELMDEATEGLKTTDLWFRIDNWIGGKKVDAGHVAEYGPYRYCCI